MTARYSFLPYIFGNAISMTLLEYTVKGKLPLTILDKEWIQCFIPTGTILTTRTFVGMKKLFSLSLIHVNHRQLEWPQIWQEVPAMKNLDIPVWEKHTLTIDEAAQYFGVGTNKLRRLAEQNDTADWRLENGNRTLIKRKQFERYIDSLSVI